SMPQNGSVNFGNWYYARWTRQGHLVGKEQLSWDFAKKAVQSCPAILLSRSFIRTNVSLAKRSKLFRR
ncbi:MAG TPA: hypothetical protein VIQ31_15685, partial [Phormidium sp.]